MYIRLNFRIISSESSQPAIIEQFTESRSLDLSYKYEVSTKFYSQNSNTFKE